MDQFRTLNHSCIISVEHPPKRKISYVLEFGVISNRVRVITSMWLCGCCLDTYVLTLCSEENVRKTRCDCRCCTSSIWTHAKPRSDGRSIALYTAAQQFQTRPMWSRNAAALNNLKIFVLLHNANDMNSFSKLRFGRHDNIPVLDPSLSRLVTVPSLPRSVPAPSPCFLIVLLSRPLPTKSYASSSRPLLAQRRLMFRYALPNFQAWE